MKTKHVWEIKWNYTINGITKWDVDKSTKKKWNYLSYEGRLISMKGINYDVSTKELRFSVKVLVWYDFKVGIGFFVAKLRIHW